MASPGLGAFCTAGRCALIIPPGAVEERLPILLEERVAPEGIAKNTIGQRVCAVSSPDPKPLALLRAAFLRMRYDESEVPPGFAERELVGFTTDGGAQSIDDSGVRDLEKNEIEVKVLTPLVAGVTAVPSRIAPITEIGVRVFDAGDPASLFRNLSRLPFQAAFHDGQRLYLGNGPRVLVYSNGIPADPTVPPDVILGKRNLSDASETPSAANIAGDVSGIWSDGRRLAVSAGHRILVWNRVPAESFAPADLVLGQESFEENARNAGGSPSAATMNLPAQIASDGERLIAADTLNHRTLVWTSFPVLNDQPADLVIGQPTFGDTAILSGAIPLYQPRGVYLDASRVVVSSTFGCACAFGIRGFPSTNNAPYDFIVGSPSPTTRVSGAFSEAQAMTAFGERGFALRDGAGGRVSVWSRSFPENNERPDLIVGKPDATLGGVELAGINASAITSGATGVFADRERLIVPDRNRVLIWHTLPSTSFAPADLVIGQPSFTTNETAIDYRDIDVDTLAHPSGIAIDGDRVAIADRSNNRVLIFRSDLDPSKGAVVLGQTDGKRFLPNDGFRAPSARSLNGPSDVYVDAHRIVVADTGNHRVLLWRGFPTTNGAPADIVLGQADFGEGRPNRGDGDLDGDGDSDASPRSMHYPASVWIANERLYVADTFNHRILVFDPVPAASGAPASRVLGQVDFVRNGPNRERGWFDVAPDGFALPSRVKATAAGLLLVADRENNRVLGFDETSTRAESAADRVFGQPDLTSNAAPNFHDLGSANAGYPRPPAASRATLHRPEGIEIAGDHVLIADTGNHRIVGFPLPAAGGTVASGLGEIMADFVIGQARFDDRTPNAGGLGAASLNGPTQLASIGDRLLIADTLNHRVLTFDRARVPMASPFGTSASSVFGQADFFGNGINRSTPERDVFAPSGVALENERLWIADRAHHRVVAFRGAAPVLVLGQVELGRALVNAGGTPSASSMNEPTDVFTDGERLIVADRSNHRVLIWRSLPDRPGEPADTVLGQPDFASSAPNAGGGILRPSARSMLAPEGVFYGDGALYVADTGNNRVLVFDGLPEENGAAAAGLLCQTDAGGNLGNRGESSPDADGCAWPTDVRAIGPEIYVADSLNHRVLVFDRETRSARAVRVLGQPTFTSRSPLSDKGTIDAATMSSPKSIEHDGMNLFVADSGNNRVLVYRSLPAASGIGADLVIGQPSADVNVSTPDLGGLRAPLRLAVEPRSFHRTRIYVADSGKERVVVFDGVPRW